jgi:hypothetical protein
LVNKLLNNQEILTVDRLVLQGKQVEATIGNWLNYFLTEKGSGMFDAVALSDFMATAPAMKGLDEEGKWLVRNLLLTYRNLKFFPDSMPSDESSEWFFLPVEVAERPVARASAPVAGVTSSGTETQATAIQPAFKPDLPTVDFNVSPAKQAQLMELKKILNNYPAGSLERLALEEEINRLEEGS